MRGIPASGRPARSGLFGALWFRLRAWSSEMRPAADSLPTDTVPNAHLFESVRVLVVDDNPVNQQEVAGLMQARGLVPWLAADGAEAVALCRQLHFDLILMDLQMPILDGLRATSAIRHFETRDSHPAVPVVAYSLSRPDASVLATHGLNGSLIKPCGDQELEDCLLQWCPAYRTASSARGVSTPTFP